MSDRQCLPQQLPLNLIFKARLSRRIAFWIFLALMLIEGVIFVPSLRRQQRDVLGGYRDVTKAKLDWIVESFPSSDPETFLRQVVNLQQKDDRMHRIEGGILYNARTGEVVGQFGRPPALSLMTMQTEQRYDRWFRLQNHYDVVWQVPQVPPGYVLITRHDASGAIWRLVGYTLTTIGGVAMISAVVTLTTMVVLEIIVIRPILDLRDQLKKSGEVLGQDNLNPENYTLKVDRRDELGEVMMAFNESFRRNCQEISQRKQAEQILQAEQERSERLLLNVLPAPIAAELKRNPKAIASAFSDVTILFADIVGFTEMSAKMQPEALVKVLNHIFSRFDEVTECYGLEKIKTIGDNYMVAGGLPLPNPDHATKIAHMALRMQQIVADFCAETEHCFQLRIGINTGPVVAGVIGTKKFIYDLWGDAVNMASRMESHGLPGRIQVTQTTCDRLADQFILSERGYISVKGKGEMVTYWLEGFKPTKVTQNVATTSSGVPSPTSIG